MNTLIPDDETIATGKVAYTAMVAALIDELKDKPQCEMPVTHRFSPGIYLREIFMPAQTFVIGHIHRTRHQNIVLTGRAQVMMDGKVVEVNAGDVFESGPGVQKILLIEQDCRWITVHANPSDNQDIVSLEAGLVALPDEYAESKGSLTLDEFRMKLGTSGALPETMNAHTLKGGNE